MTQLTQHPAYLLIEDQLDAIGQRYRVHKLIRGLMLWGTCAILATLAAAVVAHRAGPGPIAKTSLIAWIAILIVSAVIWVLRPLLIRPRALQVARLIEGRVGGLHNGLTNTVQLAHADDLKSSPWIPAIFEEVLTTSRSTSMEQAVQMRQLRPAALRLSGVAFVAIVMLLITPLRDALGHGWQQMLAPAQFVAKTGAMKIESVAPGNTTLVAGQDLDITIIASGPQEPAPDARLIFDGDLPPSNAATITPATIDDGDSRGKLRYTYRIDAVQDTLRYRVEVGGTQSSWYTATVVKQVKLQQLQLVIAPPIYLRTRPETKSLNVEDLAKTPVSVHQGSRVDITATVDVPVESGMLHCAGKDPVAMTAGALPRQFTASLIVTEQVALSMLFGHGGGQIVARLPDPPLTIHCIKDAGPQIEMRWPTQDTAAAPQAELKLAALLKDDVAIGSARVLMGIGADQPLSPVWEQTYAEEKPAQDLAFTLPLKNIDRKHGQIVRVQIEATDNRAMTDVIKDGGPQTVASSIYEIRLRDPEKISQEQKEKFDKLRAALLEMLKQQRGLNELAVTYKPGEKTIMPRVNSGQTDLKKLIDQTAGTFPFDETNRIVQKTLEMLSVNPAKEAIALSAALLNEAVATEQFKLAGEVQARQRRIISVLESLLAMLQHTQAATRPTTREGGDLPQKKEELTKLNEALKEFIKQEQRILDQTSHLAKKPVDNWDDADKKLLDDLKQAPEKMDAFMQEKIADFSKNAEQDMSNAALLKELMEVYTEVTMAKDALNKKATEVAVALEESGLELAKEIQTNLEKWLMDEPDRLKWTMEDPVGKTDTPMAELPKELEDMIGELMEQQEDLFDEIEDTNANWADSLDKGAGWDAMDGPIANMSAKGVTGNQLPNNNEMGGRSGEGRSGKSQGEMVEDTASGKGGRNTPTRLDPTPFTKGQIKDESKDPTGGASGGGKLSGQGGEGLEGPVGPQMKQQMERLAQKQAQIRNAAERLNIEKQISKYDQFRLLDAVLLMRRVEAELKANRYQNAMRQRNVILDKMDTSHLLVGGQVHVQHDTSPAASRKTTEDINDAMKGAIPQAWEGPLKEYYKKLGTQ